MKGEWCLWALNYVFLSSGLEVGFNVGIKLDKLIQDLWWNIEIIPKKTIILVIQHSVSSLSDITPYGWDQNNSWLNQLSGVIQPTCFLKKNITFMGELHQFTLGKKHSKENLSQTFRSNPLFQAFLMLLNRFITDLSDCWFEGCFVDIPFKWMQP